MPSEIRADNTSKTFTYRSFLVELDRSFKKEDFGILKFMLKDLFHAGTLETFTRPLDVFSALEEVGYLGPENLHKLRQCLEAINRSKMVELVDQFEDADSKFPLKQRSDNRLEQDGYSVSVKGGRHFDTTKGEFVEVRSGSNYALNLVNGNNHRCLVYVEIDGYEMFPNGFILRPKICYTLERPSKLPKKFKFFAIFDAPDQSGINRFRKEKNGLIQVKFCPEKADMKITCVACGSKTQTLSCSKDILDVHFLKLVSSVYGGAKVTVMITPCKPLGERQVKLIQYGVSDGSRVNVSLGVTGGSVKDPFGSNPSDCDTNKSPVKIIKWSMWATGATTLEGESDQEFATGKSFPQDMSQSVTLNLHLVARKDEEPLLSTGNPTPLAEACLIPPPVDN